MKMQRLWIAALTLTVLTGACSAAGSDGTGGYAVDTTTTAPKQTSVLVPPTTTTVPQSALADRITSLGSALYDERDHRNNGPIPTTISIDGLGVADAPVVGVGVAENGDMEIPGADTVGWYRFNPSPGESGSSVLAAHISYNGQPGVFRHLDDTNVGDIVAVGFDDGSEARFEIIELAQYDKGELPKGRVFAKAGEPVLVLITCGGEFNRSLRSYEDNIVAYAVPIGPPTNETKQP